MNRIWSKNVTNSIQEACKRIIHIAQLTYNQGFSRTGGNFSIRIDDRMIITPRGSAADYAGSIPKKSLCLLKLNGQIIRGNNPSIETEVHLALYKNDKSHFGIIHAHPPFTLAFSTNPQYLYPITQSARKFNLIICKHNPESGQKLVEAVEVVLKKETTFSDVYGLCIFVPRHGVFIASKNIERAFYYLNKVEENSHILLLENILSVQSKIY
ncbi:MAG: class II aldolase/adducin family protein [Promethearchaeota archaeon]